MFKRIGKAVRKEYMYRIFVSAVQADGKDSTQRVNVLYLCISCSNSGRDIAMHYDNRVLAGFNKEAYEG